MIHQFQDRNKISRRKKIVRVIIILGLLLLLAVSGILPFSTKIFNLLGQPLWEAKKVATEGGGTLSYLTRTKSSLLEENRKLAEENSSLKISMIDYQILSNENLELKDLLKRIPGSRDLILASILVKPSYSPYDTLIIDIGQNGGLIKGEMVYINGNVPIGIISEVYPKTSLIELYSNPGRATTGIIDGLNVNVDLVGRGGSNFEMAIPPELVVSSGTMITLPGVQAEVMAIVEEEISDPTDPVKKVILRSPVNIQNQKWVQVKKN